MLGPVSGHFVLLPFTSNSLVQPKFTKLPFSILSFSATSCPLQSSHLTCFHYCLPLMRACSGHTPNTTPSSDPHITQQANFQASNSETSSDHYIWHSVCTSKCSSCVCVWGVLKGGYRRVIPPYPAPLTNLIIPLP